jgi:hypothetical protein
VTLTPEQRTLRARIASNTRWAKTSGAEAKANGERAQRGLLERFAREIDPDETLHPVERYKRAERMRQAHMQRLSLASSKARAQKAGAV